jgi:hypothetical protein
MGMVYEINVYLLSSFHEVASDISLILAVTEFLKQITESIAIAKDNYLMAKTVQTRNINKKC